MSTSKKEWEIFKTIEIGTYKDVGSLRKALEDSGARISDWAGDIFNNITLSKSKQSLDLVALTGEELGFLEFAKLEDIYKVARNQGLDLCPAEVGPQLRLQYSDQPAGEWLVIAMEPIKNFDGDLGRFSVVHVDYDRQLYAHYAHPGSFWSPVIHFVFVRCK